MNPYFSFVILENDLNKFAPEKEENPHKNKL